MYASVWISMYASVYVLMFWIYTFVYVSECIHIYIYTSIHLHIYLLIYVYLYIWMMQFAFGKYTLTNLPPISFSESGWNIRITRTNQRLRVRSPIFLLCLGLFCTFVYVRMYVSVCNFSELICDLLPRRLLRRLLLKMHWPKRILVTI